MEHLYKAVWHYDSDGNRVCTSLRKSNVFIQGIRRDGLELPRKKRRVGIFIRRRDLTFERKHAVATL